VNAATDTARTWKVLTFDPTLSPHINWDSIAVQARQIGGHFTAINKADGSVVVTIFWDSEAERG